MANTRKSWKILILEEILFDGWRRQELCEDPNNLWEIFHEEEQCSLNQERFLRRFRSGLTLSLLY